jgi:fibronectin-binding autotransporter adhesin
MRKGMLAQWRRGLLARGLAGAALLAVPVAVAAAIGFGNSFSGLAGGLSALASGPDNPAPPPAGARPSGLSRALVALAGEPAAGGGGSGTGGGGSETESGGGGGLDGSNGGSGGSTTDGTSGSTTGGATDVPGVDVPITGDGGGAGDPTGGAGGSADGIISGVTDAVGGLVGN